MRVLVVVMGVMIVAGLGVVVATIIARSAPGSGAPANATLAEPAGTRIAGATANGDRLVLTLQGGGADRVVVLGLPSGRVLGRVSLAH